MIKTEIINYENVANVLAKDVRFQREKCSGFCNFVQDNQEKGYEADKKYYCKFFRKPLGCKIIKKENKDFYNKKVVVYRCNKCKDTFK